LLPLSPLQEEEQKRVDRELANIRKKFTATGKQLAEDGSNNALNSYSRKKYVWKLVYIHVLGYDVDFGHSEVLALVRSNKYSEKHVGYTALSLLLRGDDPMMNSILNTIRKDLTTPGPASAKNNAPTTDTAQSLALCSIANISGLELIQTLHPEVQHALVTKSSTPCVKKKAALCLLRLVRTSPKLVSGREFASQMAQLLQDKHLGVLTSSMSLLYGLAMQNSSEYQSLIPYAVHILGMLVLKKACAREYLYYRTPSPWLQIKLLKFLQLYPQVLSSGEENSGQDQSITQLVSIVSKILTETDVSDSINKSNADHAVLFEAVNLIVTWGSSGPAQLREGAMKLLGKFISVREPNIRYLGLLTMAKLAQLEGTADSIKKHQATVLVSLKDADISVRRRALDLLFVMCDTDNAERIVDELVAHLVLADAAIREEMVLKIAILAEKYATDLRWYVDTILKLISISGDHVSDAIWHRVVQIVTNHPQGDLQAYTAATLLVAASPRRCHETAVRVAAYVLGEFGFLVAERPGMSGEEQFRILHQHWATSDATTRAILVSTYAKLANLYEECRPLVAPVFARCKNSVDVEIQQRSAEYAAMREAFSPEAVEDLLREMPPFEDKKQSALEQRLREKEGEDSAAVAKAIRPSAAQRQRQQQSQAAARAAEEVAAQQAAEQNAMNDPISPISDGSPGAGPLDRPTVGIPKDVIPAMRKAFSNLCTSPSGVLFENSLLQVGVKHEYVGAQGRISVFFGNLSKAPLLHFRAVVDDQDHLKVQKQGTQGLLDDSDEGGCTVAVRTQAKLLLLVEVTAPFDDAPAMRVIFETEEGELHEYPLRLPIVATCFMEPVTLEPGAFMQRWRSLEGQDRECQEVVKAPPNAPAVDEEYMKRIAIIITDGLKFGRCQGCDPTPWTVSGAATFRTGSKDANGNNINVGCLIRVEANPQAGAFRVTTRTLHPLCSKAVKNVALVSIKLA
jgi:AP-2 complex subunit alpha